MSTPVTIANLYEDLQARLSALHEGAPMVADSRRRVEDAIQSGEPLYGINTGFGALAAKRIDSEQLEALQENLILSHAVGVGDPIPRDITRLMLQLKVSALGRGLSGVSESTFGRLLQLLEHDLVPVVPSRGSVGASGDLAPLAHLALPLLGEGQIWTETGVADAGPILHSYGLGTHPTGRQRRTGPHQRHADDVCLRCVRARAMPRPLSPGRSGWRHEP